MGLVQSDFEFIRLMRGFPAPLCEPCNQPMGLKGEYTPTVHGKMTLRREYQCRLCGAALTVQRSKAFA
jgi:hypothetical protein